MIVNKFNERYCCVFQDGKREELTLDESGEAELKEIIHKYLRPIKRPWVSSYFLKHQLEKLMKCGYISNADCKKAMVECGFKPETSDYQNWKFNVSRRSLSEIRKIKKGRFTYE